MNYRAVLYFLGKIMLILCLLMLLPLAVCLYYILNGFKEASLLSFVIPILLLLITGILLTAKKPANFNVFTKEGFAICGLAWIIISLVGAIPFVISNIIPNYIDAFFETVSGFTTTGSSILGEIHSLPKSILFWRSFTHWIGGMGILSFMIAIIPKAKGSQMFIMKAEVPGPTPGKVVSKISDSARILYIIYSVMTLLQIFILYFGNMITGDNIRFFDCVVTAFSTAGTGGFSVLNNSILGYESPFTEWVCIVFMFLFGVNFNLYYFLITRRFSDIVHDEELRGYILINILSSLMITVNIIHLYDNAFDAVRDAFFNVNSIMSTTGFCTVNYSGWPTFSKMILVLIMCIGSSAGSTGGGFKVVRLELVIKQILCDIRKMLRPNTVIKVRLNKKTVDDKVMKSITSYLSVYVLLLMGSIFLLSIDKFDTATTVTAAITCMNNAGPGLGAIDPIGNFADFSVLSKLVLIFDMLAGRLELFPILLLFSPNIWKRSK